jgi:hypothetical protein
MSGPPGNLLFADLYKLFSEPLTGVDCGEKCGPYNDYGVPVCCDIQLLVPAAYDEEWTYLSKSTDLWHPWQGDQEADPEDLQKNLQSGQVLLECLGYQRCQRPYRSITCRAFPFYPYLSSRGEFLGLAYYRDFRDQCWIISNLNLVSQDYIIEFQGAYQRLFEFFPETRRGYIEFSAYMREQTSSAGEDLVLLGFSDLFYFVHPSTEKVSEINVDELDSFGPFKIAKGLVFPDEMRDLTTGKHGG